MGGPEQPPQSGPGSSGSTQSEIDPYVAKSKHRRNTSDQHLGSDTPKVGQDPAKIITKIIKIMITIVIMILLVTTPNPYDVDDGDGDGNGVLAVFC